MPDAETNKTSSGAKGASRLVSSDLPVPSAPSQTSDEPQYLVGGQPVSREEYIKALPAAGWMPERMPANFFPPLPAVDTK